MERAWALNLLDYPDKTSPVWHMHTFGRQFLKCRLLLVLGSNFRKEPVLGKFSAFHKCQKFFFAKFSRNYFIATLEFGVLKIFLESSLFKISVGTYKLRLVNIIYFTDGRCR